MNTNLKRYIISSVVTFIATFSAAVLPFLGDLKFTKAALVAVALVGIRAGIKSLFEALASVQITDADLES